MSKPFQIFIAYSRKDSPYLDELRIHLTPLERSGRVKVWYDGKIEPGQVWEQAIKENLHSADIILLLVSADAINSDYFYEKEMADALARHHAGEARVVPLIVRSCLWQATPLRDLQALPKDGQPVTNWPDRDDAYHNCVSSIWMMIEDEQRKVQEQLEQERRAVEEEKQRKAAEARRKKEKEKRQAEEAQRQRRSSLDPFHDLMIPVEGGTFQMGDGHGDLWDACRPVHGVTVQDFNLLKHPVTQAQWRAVMGSYPPELNFKGCDDCPVERVSWDDVQDFIKKLNEKTGSSYRLPTEAEWEFAARGGNKSKKYKFAGSDNVDEVAWYSGNAGSKTHPVMQKKANELGLFDMSGNVWEWCQDVWHGNYEGAPKDGSAWTSGGEQAARVLRGGSWRSSAGYCRAAYRGRNPSASRYSTCGFRIVSVL